MIEYWDFWHGYEAPYGGQGTATTLPIEPERDFGAELRQAVEDVTGRKVEVAEKPRMGFL